MNLRKKFGREIIQIKKENKKVTRRRLSLGQQIKKVADLREKLIEEMVFEIRASLDFDIHEIQFIQLPVGKDGLFKELIMRSEYIPNIAGKVKSKDSDVSVSKARLRTVCRIENIRNFIKQINSKLVDFDIKISITGETAQRYYFQVIV